MKGMVTDEIWLGEGVYDANASSGEFDWSSVGEGEYLKHLEVGCTPAFARRAKNTVQLTWWEKDRRKDAGTPCVTNGSSSPATNFSSPVP
ncbi:MAG TPA: hypothetical protein VIS55_03795 [Pseudomonadales bacterium]|jgi:hypothetical protein